MNTQDPNCSRPAAYYVFYGRGKEIKKRKLANRGRSAQNPLDVASWFARLSSGFLFGLNPRDFTPDEDRDETSYCFLSLDNYIHLLEKRNILGKPLED